MQLDDLDFLGHGYIHLFVARKFFLSKMVFNTETQYFSHKMSL